MSLAVILAAIQAASAPVPVVTPELRTAAAFAALADALEEAAQ